jgi:hypothetical protein
MAEDKDKPNINMTAIKNLEQNAQDNLNKIYTSIKFSDPTVSNAIELMRNRMHRSIDKLMANNVSNTGVSNISSLWVRSKNIQNDQSIIDGITSTFENESIMNNVMSLYSQNTYLREFDKEIEVVCKYMPKLEDALDTRKEHVLSADHFSKNSINIVNSSAGAKDNAADVNIKDMREKYEIDELLEKTYENADRKGEEFLYIVPYKKAIKKLLKADTGSTNNVLSEATYFTYNESKNTLNSNPIKDITTFKKQQDGIIVEVNTSGVIQSAVKQHEKAINFIAETANLGLNENGRIIRKNVQEDNKTQLGAKKLTTDKLTVDPTDIQKKFYNVDSSSQDGFVATDKSDTDLKVPGCVCKRLDHSMVKPLYIEDVCLGYFYIECDKTMDLDQVTFSSTLGGIRPGGSWKKPPTGMEQDQDNIVLKKIAAEISDHVDSKFINLNQDLTKEIYYILKYNRDVGMDGKINKIRVTFIPAEDMVHVYFDKDPDTHRGISGLAKALFPAKLYSCLYISNVLTILTRGQDKRVYYVKQAVDTNIAGVLLNTINQIKKSNFGLRQVENLNNIMNITGRFNDLIIPKSPSGEAPVEMEVLQGQNVDVKTELMNILEEMAVNSTDVPLEVIQARQQLDYATHYTMSNSKFLRKVYNRQAKTEKIFNKILTKIYDAEYECQDIITVTLPPPMYLNLQNTSQIFQMANDMAQNATDMWAGDQEDDVQQRFSRGVKKHYLGSFLPMDVFDKLLDDAKMASKQKQKPEEQ